MHLWKVHFRVGDFGSKTLTVKTADRAAAGEDADGNPLGGFAEVERRAMQAAQSETSGWPTPIEIAAIEYVDELSAEKAPTAPARAKRR